MDEVMTMVSRQPGLDGRHYTDPDVLAHELDRIFAHTWQLVGHTSQVASPGQAFTAPVGDESVLVVNHDGAVRGLYNVCQHRGHRLVESDSANLSAITCPYHAWTYDLGGRLVTARGEDVGELCVPPVRLDTMAGFLFANLDPDAIPLQDAVPGAEAELLAMAPDAGQRVLSSRRTHLINANWKIAVENYNECYHCPNIHKSFTTKTVNPGSYRITPRGFAIRHAAQGASPKPSGAAGRVEAGSYGAIYTWPVSSIQCYPGRELNTFRWVPLAVDQTMLIREWWLDRTDPTPEQREVIERDWATTVAEDLSLMESVQQGAASRGYRPGPLIVDPSGVADVHTENAVAHLQRLLLDALGGP